MSLQEKARFSLIQKKFYSASGIDLKSIVHDIVKFGDESRKQINELSHWIKNHSDIYKMEKVILYHGTSSKHDIENEGIKKTSSKNRKSIQSASGFVYLSLYPDMAQRFAEMAYAGEEVSVYAVEVLISDLVPDHDQLKNKRLWLDGDSSHIGKTIGDSLAYGSGARVKRNIEPYELRDITDILTSEKDIKSRKIKQISLNLIPDLDNSIKP